MQYIAMVLTLLSMIYRANQPIQPQTKPTPAAAASPASCQPAQP